MRLVHPLISNLVAERVGVASLRRLLIVRSADALSLASVPGSAAEAFGQSEALTTRLKHIISDYPEGAGGHRMVEVDASTQCLTKGHPSQVSSWSCCRMPTMPVLASWL